MAALGWLQNLALGGSPQVDIQVGYILGDVIVEPAHRSPALLEPSYHAHGESQIGIDGIIQSRLDGLLTDPVDKELFSPAYSSGGDNTWNPDCWAAELDFSGLSPWNSQNANFGGVLISPQHVLFVWHTGFTPVVDTEIVFVKADGSECSRTIVGRERVGVEDDYTDLGVCYLDRAVDSDVTFYKCTVGHWLGWMELSKYRDLPYTRGDPVVVCDREEKALVGEVEYLAFFVGWFPQWAFLIIEGDPPLDAYWEEIVPGDSGHPSFLILNNELVLLGLHSRWFPDWSPPVLVDTDIGANLVLIEAAMSDLDTDNTGYQLTLFDFTKFEASHRHSDKSESRGPIVEPRYRTAPVTVNAPASDY